MSRYSIWKLLSGLVAILVLSCDHSCGNCVIVLISDKNHDYSLCKIDMDEFQKDCTPWSYDRFENDDYPDDADFRILKETGRSLRNANKIFIHPYSMKISLERYRADLSVRPSVRDACRDGYMVPRFESYSSVEKEKGMIYPAIFSGNSSYDFIYPVILKREYLADPYAFTARMNKLLCGVREGKSEVVFEGTFWDYYSTGTGRFILVLRRKERGGGGDILIVDPKNHSSRLLLADARSIDGYVLNASQSALVLDEAAIYVYDHVTGDLTEILSRTNLPSGLLIGSELISFEKRGMVFELYREKKYDERYLGILDFPPNERQPQLRLMSLENGQSILGMIVPGKPLSLSQ